MAEQVPLGGGFPWATVLESASPWTLTILLAYLLWDTIKRQAKSADLLAGLTTILQARLGELTHELAEVRRAQSSFTASFSGVDESLISLGKTLSQEIRSSLLERAVLRSSHPPSTLPDKDD